MAATFEHDHSHEPVTLEEAREVIKMLRDALIKMDEAARMDVLIKTMLNKAETERLVEDNIEKKKPFGVLLVDLNNFKQVNDRYGHIKGDELLISIGLRLHESFRRETDEIGLMSTPSQGRIGGDEFVVVADLSEDERRETNAHVQMDKLYGLLKKTEAEFVAENPIAQDLNVGFSIGAAVFDPACPLDAKMLIAQADEAMYEEKNAQKNYAMIA